MFHIELLNQKKMKTLKVLSFAWIAVLLFAACGDSAKTTAANAADSVATAGATAATYNVDVAASELHWHGYKMAYGHGGIINITTGSLSVENGNITAGNFSIDMNSLRETGNDDAASAAKLEGHLKSEDFFAVEKYPTSKFEITASTPAKTDTTTHTIKGNLTIKDITKNIEFPALVKIDGNTLTANAAFSINRNDWGVVYGSGLSGAIGDKIISDNIDYKVSLKATKQ
jgi:polyisoprenoid-binding protein YceI